jgi:hypothetical protein
MICCVGAKSVYAQVTINLTQNDITTQAPINQSVAAGSTENLTALTSIDFKSNSINANFTTSTTGSPTLPLNVAFIKVLSIVGVSLGGGSEINLTNQPQSIFGTVLGLGPSVVTLNYRIPTIGTAWQAGSYTTPTTVTRVSLPPPSLTIVVPAFIAVNSIPPLVTLTVSALSNFRTGSLTGSHSFDYFTSVASDIQLKATSTSSFSFSTSEPKIVDPSPASNFLKAHTTVPGVGSQISLTNADQTVFSNIAVQATNKRSSSTTFTLSAADLKSSFVQAGTYTLPLTYSIAKNTAAYGTVTAATSTSSVQVVVPRLFECVIPTANLLFDLSNINSYRNGMTVAIPNPFVVSSTIPYNITVKASGDFTNGSGGTIPANTVTVEGTAAQTGITSVILSAVDQSLVTGAAPVIDRSLNLQYRISPTQATNMLGKTAGTYQNTITFTCTAP